MLLFPDIDRSAELVRHCWRTGVEHRSDEFTLLFYGLLFDAEPGIEQLFPRDVREQRRHLMEMMDFLVMNDLHRPEIKEQVRRMAREHFGPHVPIGLFLTVSATMCHALSIMLEDRWDRDLAMAWRTVSRQIYDVIVYDYV